MSTTGQRESKRLLEKAKEGERLGEYLHIAHLQRGLELLLQPSHKLLCVAVSLQCSGQLLCENGAKEVVINRAICTSPYLHMHASCINIERQYKLTHLLCLTIKIASRHDAHLYHVFVALHLRFHLM
jgi:hypothetical protein